MPVTISDGAVSLLAPKPKWPPPVSEQALHINSSVYWKWVETLEKCDLADADYVGRRVRGTSSDSVYRVVAVSAKANVGARISGGNLSVRLEDKTLDDEVGGLIEKSSCPLIQAAGGHYSRHFKSVKDIRATLMAVIGSIPVAFDAVGLGA